MDDQSNELRAARGLEPEATESQKGGDASCAPDSASTPVAPHTEWSAPASNASASNAAPESNPPAAAETCRCGDVLPASEMVDTPNGRMCRNCEAGLADAAAERCRECDIIGGAACPEHGYATAQVGDGEHLPPSKIHLQWHGAGERSYDDMPHEVTWCADQINASDEVYYHERELDALRERVAELEGERASEWNKNRELKSHCATLSAALAAKDARIAELEAVISGEIYETKALKSRDELEKQLAAKESNLAHADEKIRELQNFIGIEVKAQLAAKEAEIAKLKSDHANLLLRANTLVTDAEFSRDAARADLAAVTAHNQALRAALEKALPQAEGCWMHHYGDNPEGGPAPEHIALMRAALALAPSAALAKRDAEVGMKWAEKAWCECYYDYVGQVRKWAEERFAESDTRRELDHSATRREIGGGE